MCGHPIDFPNQKNETRLIMTTFYEMTKWMDNGQKLYNCPQCISIMLSTIVSEDKKYIIKVPTSQS